MLALILTAAMIGFCLGVMRERVRMERRNLDKIVRDEIEEMIAG